MTDTATITTAVCQLLREEGMIPMTEYCLPNGRRVDVAALTGNGRLVGIEVKQEHRDFNRDLKWPDIMSQCFLFYFAVPRGFNIKLIHPGIRVIVVDGDRAKIVRKAGRGLLNPSSWHDAGGRYAVNPAAPGAALRSAPTGDRARARVILP